jgi:phosphohistidine phosphatase
MAIYLVQHGKSLSREQDPQKGLSDEGVSEVQRIAQVAADYGVRVSHIVHSGKKRARQTAEILAGALKPDKGPDIVEGINPLDDVSEYARKIDINSAMMVVGHLPFLEKLAARLITGKQEPPVFKMQNGGILCLDHYEGTDHVVIKWALMPNIG